MLINQDNARANLSLALDVASRELGIDHSFTKADMDEIINADVTTEGTKQTKLIDWVFKYHLPSSLHSDAPSICYFSRPLVEFCSCRFYEKFGGGDKTDIQRVRKTSSSLTAGMARSRSSSISKIDAASVVKGIVALTSPGRTSCTLSSFSRCPLLFPLLSFSSLTFFFPPFFTPHRYDRVSDDFTIASYIYKVDPPPDPEKDHAELFHHHMTLLHDEVTKKESEFHPESDAVTQSEEKEKEVEKEKEKEAALLKLEAFTLKQFEGELTTNITSLKNRISVLEKDLQEKADEVKVLKEEKEREEEEKKEKEGKITYLQKEIEKLSDEIGKERDALATKFGTFQDEVRLLEEKVALLEEEAKRKEEEMEKEKNTTFSLSKEAERALKELKDNYEEEKKYHSNLQKEKETLIEEIASLRGKEKENEKEKEEGLEEGKEVDRLKLLISEKEKEIESLKDENKKASEEEKEGEKLTEKEEEKEKDSHKIEKLTEYVETLSKSKLEVESKFQELHKISERENEEKEKLKEGEAKEKEEIKAQLDSLQEVIRQQETDISSLQQQITVLNYTVLSEKENKEAAEKENQKEVEKVKELAKENQIFKKTVEELNRSLADKEKVLSTLKKEVEKKEKEREGGKKKEQEYTVMKLKLEEKEEELKVLFDPSPSLLCSHLVLFCLTLFCLRCWRVSLEL